MISPATLAQLRAAQEAIWRLIEPLDDYDYRRQFHPDLSPLGWHAGHCAFVETYWLREVLCGEDASTAPLHGLYFPENIPKPERGPALPPAATLLSWGRALQADNRARLQEPPHRLRDHRLLRGEYLPRFLIQHYAQHHETMRMVLAQRARRQPAPATAGAYPDPVPPGHEGPVLASGDYEVGSAGVAGAYDNELPGHTVPLAAVRLGARPVTNAQYLAFIEDGGYRRTALWPPAARRWLLAGTATHPEYWRPAPGGGWLAVDGAGFRPLQADAPVRGLSWFEASAFASWAGARLPHELEWEAAAREGLLDGVGGAWEWCANAFHPYPGFRPFPYERYSVPWFGGDHYTLRGAGPDTHTAIRRPGFRNFYGPQTRYPCAGLRLARED